MPGNCLPCQRGGQRPLYAPSGADFGAEGYPEASHGGRSLRDCLTVLVETCTLPSVTRALDTAKQCGQTAAVIGVIAPIVGALTALLAFAQARTGALADDALITARYAVNIAHGYGWVWNPGTAPTDGTTAPLWTLMLALTQLVHLPLVPAALALDSLLYGCMTALLCALVYRIAGPLAAGAAAVLFAGMAWTVAQDTPGFETPLYCTLVAGTLLLFHQRRYGASLAVCSLLPLVRGDGVLLLGIVMAVVGLDRSCIRRLPMLAAALVPLACWELFSLATFHALLPSSFLAKHAQAYDISGKVSWAFFLSAFPELVVLVLPAIVGFVVCRRTSTMQIIAAWITAYVCFYCLVANVPEQWWYVVPVYWILAVPAAASLCAVQAHGRRSFTRVIVCAIVLVSTFPVLAGDTSAHLVRAGSGSTPSVQEQAALYLRKHPGGLVAAYEIGAVGFYSNHPVVDIIGLVSPEVIPHLAQFDYTWVLHRDQPEYVFIGDRPPARVCTHQITCVIWADPWFRSHYRVVRSWPYVGARYLLLRLRRGPVA